MKSKQGNTDLNKAEINTEFNTFRLKITSIWMQRVNYFFAVYAVLYHHNWMLGAFSDIQVLIPREMPSSQTNREQLFVTAFPAGVPEMSTEWNKDPVIFLLGHETSD